MSKDSCEAAVSAAGAALRIARAELSCMKQQLYMVVLEETCLFYINDVMKYPETVTNKTLLHKVCVMHIRYTMQVI